MSDNNEIESLNGVANEQQLLTNDDCEQILSKLLNGKDNGKLRSFQLKPEFTVVGYLGNYFQLELKYEMHGELYERRLFVKTILVMGNDEDFNQEKLKVFEKEIILYEQLLNELRTFSPSVWSAACYLVKKNLFVMENIKDLNYLPIKETLKFLNQQQTKSLLKGLALLHASSIAYEQKHKTKIGEKFRDVLFEPTVSPTVPWYTTGLKAVLSLISAHAAYQNEADQNFIKNDLPTIFDSVYEMVNPSEKYRNVFCHRDVWIGNLFFKQFNDYVPPIGVADDVVDDNDAEIAPCIFVDFQLCRYAPAAIDLLMALYLNLEPKVRKAYMWNYCRYYYEAFAVALAKMGINADAEMSLRDFQNSIEDLELFGALYNCIAATVIRVPANYLINLKQQEPEVYLRYAKEDRTKEVLELMATNEEFSAYMNECIEDLMSLNLKQETKL